MAVILEKAVEADVPVLFAMQLASFTPLLEKYQDYETSPAAETIGRLAGRVNNPQGSFYKILAAGQTAGAINVKWKEENRFWIGPLFVLPEYQGQGFAQSAICQVESLYPTAESWELFTLLEEQGNCYLYEKLGYRKTGKIKKLNNRATLVHYRKNTFC